MELASSATDTYALPIPRDLAPGPISKNAAEVVATLLTIVKALIEMKKIESNIYLHLITANFPVRSPIPGASIWYRYTPYAISKLSLDNIFQDSVPFSKTSS